jgi:transcriptional regulator with XRE-family HTH domain
VPTAAPHPFLKKLGGRIRRLRDRKGLSQEALADLARLDRSYMSGIERGIRNVSILNLVKIARALGLHVTSLFETE